ncbi:hypothetical protein ANRL4_00220 [Anaerolineae bacterium]|nr:hypothetical protein ANRL4_00220 [Anaerolineae bacterium]
MSADTIVPDPSNPQSLNRFSYVRNHPLKYTDPTGHIERYDEGGGGGLTCQQTNTCVTFGEYFENVILPVAAFFFDGAEYAELFNQCRKGECTAGDVLLTLIPTGIGKVFKGGSKALGLADNLPMGAVDDLPLGTADGVGSKLLLGEGMVGTYDDLIAAGSKGDNLTPHHVPSAEHMGQYGVKKGDGITINMEQPVPGSGGRHRQTFTYGTQADLNMSPRDALAAGIRDLRSIYQNAGAYNGYIRGQLQEIIRMNKAAFPNLFR